MINAKNYSLTNPQKSIWNMEEFFKGTTINNICSPDIIYEKIDEATLKQAINNIVKKNDNFRIQIKLEGGKPVQYIIDYSPFDIEVIHIKDESALKELEKEAVKYKFNIIDSCLYNFKIFIFENGFGGFILTAHHMIIDSWTVGLVVNSVINEYYAIQKNEVLPCSDTSYIDYINSEKEYKESKKYEIDKDYWNSVFKDIPEIATVPSNKALSNSYSYEAKREPVFLPSDLMQNIKSFCADNKISVFNFLMAIYSIYIGRVSNLDDFVIGTPILNRGNYKEKHTMGMFINTAPVRVNTSKAGPFIEFAHSFSSNMMGILKHQKYSYNQILEDARNKDANIPNLYNVLISYQITKAFQGEYNNYKPYWVFNNYSGNDLNIHISDYEDTNELLINYDYSIDKYEAEDVQALHARVLHIMEQVLENKDILTDKIEIVTEEEKNKVLFVFNNTVSDFPQDKTIIDLFEEQVKNNPNNTAVIFENKKITYKELNEKSNSLAHYLRENGVTNKDVVCILLDRSLDLITSIYSVIKTGAAYVVIDTNFPTERINYIINDSNAKFYITNNIIKEINSSCAPVCINNFDFNQNYENIQNNHDENFCIIYTSGSTGNPKGVLLHEKGLINLIDSFNKEIETSTFKNILGIATVSFDMFAFELFSATLYGNTLVLANEEEQKNIHEMSNLIEKNNVEFFITTPSRVGLLLLENNGSPLKNVKSILLGGENLTSNLYDKLCVATNAKIFNTYGPTEITAGCTTKLITKNDISIGRPVSNMQIYICDSNMNLQPIGVIGEICVAGIGVANGYLNKPDITSKHFVKNPFGEGNIYKTGDLGKFKSNGELEYVGRSDFQVKLRGLRIELGEIEDKILKIPNINSCVVVKKVDDLNHEFLCAYYTASINIASKEIRNKLEKILPNYMIPRYFTKLEALPYTRSGKIDIKNLPEPQIEVSDKKIILPRNEIDKKIIEILKELLHVNSISIDDSFFELGGDSLSAINLCVIIKNTFNLEVFVKDILENPIIKDISDIIAENENKINNQEILKAAPAEYYPISSAQKRIYFSSKVAENAPTLYNTPGAIILEGNLDIKKLENCINTLINRHESLRTYFDTENENVVQKILDKINFNLDVLENIDFNNLDNTFKKFVKPFDLSKAPLLRIRLIKFTNGKFALFIDMHHIISDGTSLQIFIDELCKLYNGSELIENKITYKDYAVFENERLSSGELKEAENYWLNMFEGEIPVLDIPTNYPRPTVQSYEGKKVYSIIDKNIVEKIRKISPELNVTPYMFLLSAYYILLSKYTSNNDIVVGSPVVGRDIADTYNIIGMFVNTLALRQKIDSQNTFKEFLLLVKENMLNAYKYQTYPFDELVNKLHVQRDTSRSPLFDVMFIYQNNGYGTLDLNGIKTENYIPDSNISKFDLSLEVLPDGNVMNISFEYVTKLFDEEFIENLSKHYLNILNNVVENIDTKISNIEILSKEEKNKILLEFNNTTTEYPREKTIVNLFEEQVEKTPDNIAVVFENEKLTYKELNEKSNSLANYLKNNGVNQNDVISIFLDKSLEAIVAILATLKCGCSYMPIDIDYPQTRIDYMIKNSRSKIILTSNNIKDKLDNSYNAICIDLSNEEIYKNNIDNFSINSNSDDLAYIMYTSGSTGEPKGVMVSNKNVVRLVKNTNFIKFEKQERILQTGSIVFDACTFEIWAALLNGFELYVMKKQDLLDSVLLEKYLKNNKISILWLTAPLFNRLSENNPKMFDTVRVLLTGGDVLSTRHINAVREACPNLTVINGYGPTENTTFSTCFTINKNYEDNIPIGFPIANSTCYIVSKDMCLVPVDVPGELLVGGDGVSKGYLNNEKQTLDKFIPNKFGTGTLYKTGDLVKWCKDGSIMFLGRIDHQTKIRGFRVELGEIESRILEYPHIKRVLVLKQTVQNRDCILAYFVADKRIAINELRKHISKTLPKYMLPSYFIPLDDFPFNQNGKIDKKALPVPNEMVNSNKKDYVAPQTELQKQLVLIWEKVLNIKPIGIKDDFFELGGDSLLAMNLHIELLKISNKITYSDIFRFSTIAEQEEKIKSNIVKPMFNKIENLSGNYADVLKKCTVMSKINNWHPNGVLLAGSTGFLGIHVLEEFIKNETCNIYCIIREEPGLTAKTKLKQKMNYYFGNKYDDLIDKRVFAVPGNISQLGFDLSINDLSDLANSIDVVINCAALVIHFGKYEDFYNANVQSVRYMIEFCKKFNKKLYHVSTIDVSGVKLDSEYLSNKNENNLLFDESTLYIGQILDNVYIRSKFEAENYLLDGVSTGLDGYILRMGNLMPRYRDTVFQENMADNAFANKIIAFIRLGIVPDYLYREFLDFTPIDYAAQAIYKLVTHPSENNRIFNLHDNHIVSVVEFFKILDQCGCHIDVIDEDKFKEKIRMLLEDDNSKGILNNLIYDFNEELKLDYEHDFPRSSDFTVKYLKKIHFKWPKINKKYLTNFINLLKGVL